MTVECHMKNMLEGTRERLLHTLQIAQLLRAQADRLGDAAIGKNPTDQQQLKLADRCIAQADALLASALEEIEGLK